MPKRAVRDNIVTKRIYEPAAGDDGTRVLVMRLWPRGIRKDRVDLWLRDLGPTVPLLRGFRSGDVSWPEYVQRYVAEFDRPEKQRDVAEVLGLARTGRVTILCGCADETRCHRTLLAEHLRRQL
jgi:uncharacterized protein YeaO (DUF488 family)